MVKNKLFSSEYIVISNKGSKKYINSWNMENIPGLKKLNISAEFF